MTQIVMQYFSKWRKKWIDFKQPPGQVELTKMKQFHYRIRTKPA